MKRKTMPSALAALCSLAAMAAGVRAADPAAGPFALADAPGLGVAWRGNPFIVDENIVFAPRTPAMDGPYIVHTRGVGRDGASVGNLHREDPDFAWRREAAVSRDGSEVEITFQCQTNSYVVPLESAGEGFRYSFSVDAAPLDGMKWRVQQGRTNSPAFAEGVFLLNGKDGPLVSGTARHIAFDREDGTGLFFDFNPEGVRAYSDFGPGNLQGLWSIDKRGGRLVFSFGASFRFFGGAATSKVVVFEGNRESFPDRHVAQKYGYAGDLDYERAYVFGAEKFGDFYTDAGLAAWAPDKPFGWVDAKGLSVVHGAPSGALYSAVEGKQPAAFRVAGLRPGVYIATLRTAAYDKAAGPFSLSQDGKAVADGISLAPNESVAVSWPVWIEDGSTEFRFEGQWRLSALVLQFLMHSKEDFKFRRGIWHLDGYEPALLYRNAHYAQPPVFKTAIEKTPLAPHGFKTPADYHPTFKAAFETPSPDSMPWRYAGTLGSYGPGNAGAFDTFAAMADKERRLDEVRKEGIDVVIVNGLLSRHTFPAHIDRTVDFMRDFTAAAHRRDMRVIDHQDYALLWNMDSGFRVLTEQVDRLQRRLDGGGAAIGFCPVNPLARGALIDYALRLVKEADIDGLMLDEVYFLSGKHCGCRYCREGFAADSGLALPMDETHPSLFNAKDRLWRTWILWRRKALANFFHDLRRAATAAKPDFSMLIYTTHYGWSNNHAPHNLGSDLLDKSLSHDFIGTEIMSRNVMASRRPVMAFRKMKSAIRHQYDKPVFGLVYPQGDWSIAYFGWALNAMNRQTTWFARPPPHGEGLPDFTAFPEAFSQRHARPAASTALLFSHASRDWAQLYSYIGEPLGVSQTLTDKHLMHDFVLSASLTTPGKLAPFRNLFVLNAVSLSDAEVAAIRSFASKGGTVYLSAHAGAADELGMDRGRWPFADVFGFGLRYPLKKREVAAVDTPWGSHAFPKPVAAPMLSGAFEKPKGKVLAAMTVGGVSVPLAVEAKLGAGRLVYSALPFGNLVAEREQTVGNIFKPGEHPELAKLYGDMLADLFFKDDAFQAVAVPEKVMVSILRVEEPGQPATLVVNLLNATGVHVDAGAKIPAAMPVDWGRVEAPIVFRVRLDGLVEAYAVSPDFEGRRPVAFREAGRGVWEVAVEPEQLKHYTAVHLR